MAYKFEYLASSNTSPRSNFADYAGVVDTIMIHHWGIDGQRHSNVVRWLRGKAGGSENRGSSAHYVTSANLVSQLVNESVAAWACKGANGRMIHIECRPEMTKGDWATLVELCADIEERRGSQRYTRHKDHWATACPGRYSRQLAKLIRDINAEHKRRGNDPNDPRKRIGKAAAKKVKPAPVKAKKATGKRAYTGPSLVDYLRSIGKSSSFASRRTLAHNNGIKPYTGTARQNTQLLNKLRGGGSRSGGKTVAAMAQEVIAGRHGNGHAQRRSSLGVDAETYRKVRAEVNRRL